MRIEEKRKGLFVGAGFSYEFGMPLVTGLTNEFKNFFTASKLCSLKEKWKAGGLCISDQVILDLDELLKSNLNYEEIISRIDVEINKRKNSGDYDGLQFLRVKILDMITGILQQRHVLNLPFIKSGIQMHRGIKSLVSKGYPLWIFSLNHDIIIEMLAMELSIPIKNGFSDEKISLIDINMGVMQEFRTLKMEQKFHPSYNYFMPNEYGINLLKMHGSLDVFGFDDLKQYLCVAPKANDVTGYLESLKYLYEKVYLKTQGGILNHIIMRDSRGEEQYLQNSLLTGEYKFVDQSKQVGSMKLMELFENSLLSIDELIILGYSFGDRHINDRLKKWLEISPHKNIIIIDPKKSAEAPVDFQHLREQFSIREDFSQNYFSALPGGELYPDEIILRDARRKDRKY